LGVIGQNPSVSKSNQFTLCCDLCDLLVDGYYFQAHPIYSSKTIFLKSRTSTGGYFSNSTGSSVTSGRWFSWFIVSATSCLSTSLLFRIHRRVCTFHNFELDGNASWYITQVKLHCDHGHEEPMSHLPTLQHSRPIYVRGEPAVNYR
jgi:hypothetical protein